MHQPVVEPAEQECVADVGGPARRPGTYVVGVGVRRGPRAAREATTPVAQRQEASLVRREEPLGAPERHGEPVRIERHRSDLGVTGDARDALRVQRSGAARNLRQPGGARQETEGRPRASRLTPSVSGPAGHHDLKMGALTPDQRQQPVVAGRPDDVGEAIGPALRGAPRVVGSRRDQERF